MVQSAVRKNVDADYFSTMFGFDVAATTIWNARKTAAGLLGPTTQFIMDEVKFLGIDGTYYSVNSKKGYAWVVRTDRATLVLVLPTSAGIVIPSELLDKPVTTDDYSPYLTYFKILQMCWAHIRRDVESAYVRAPKEMQKYYHTLYQRLLTIYREAKKASLRTGHAGGADTSTCRDFQKRGNVSPPP